MADKPMLASLFSQVDVTTGSQPQSNLTSSEEHVELIREMLVAQDRTNELLEELVGFLSTQHKQRAIELNNWREANPKLAKSCRSAAESLSDVQAEFLDRLTEEVQETKEEMVYGDFMLTEFVDRYGPRLAHLNGVIQALAQLGGNVTTESQED